MEDGGSVKVTNVAINHFQGVKLTTTADTETSNMSEQFDVDWTNIENGEQEVQLICHEIAAVELKKFKVCANLDCKRKVLPYPGEKTVKCNSCRRKMFTDKCKENFTIEVTVGQDNGSQVVLTLFPKVVTKAAGEEKLRLKKLKISCLD